MQFVIHKAVNTAFPRQPFDHIICVFPNTLAKIARHPDVNRTISLAGKNIDLSLSRLRNGGDEFCGSAAFDCPLRRLPLVIQLPMAGWAFIGRIENWMIEKWITHVNFFS
jgi:hypothetical protein